MTDETKLPDPAEASEEEGLLEPSANLMEEVDMERRVRAFVQGEITLADLHALPQEELYDIAEYGQRIFNQGKFDDAETIFLALTALDPYDENFHAGLGSIYQQQGRVDDALVEYDRAIQCNNFLLPALVNRAELLMQQGRMEQVMEDLKKVFEYDPNSESGYTQRARGLAMSIATAMQEEATRKEQSS